MGGEPDTHGVAAPCNLEMGVFTPSPEQTQPKMYAKIIYKQDQDIDLSHFGKKQNILVRACVAFSAD